MSDRVQLEKQESEFANWLTTLDSPQTSPHHRAVAIKRVAELYMGSRAAEDRAEKQLQAQRIRIETLEKECAAARLYRSRVAALTIEALGEDAVAIVITKLEKAGVEIVQTPGRPATLVPCRLVKEDA